ncbi:hypothetical protein PIB30_009115 [Stylosanthes scabra]|uniref:Uncharacterized protein n=1 Tax=Stylosanthes scabra TaxID=79078 RepID=A0ABU6W530_9FABA|nr:hypothetical protein [Stylosanthes scabra]
MAPLSSELTTAEEEGRVVVTGTVGARYRRWFETEMVGGVGECPRISVICFVFKSLNSLMPRGRLGVGMWIIEKERVEEEGGDAKAEELLTLPLLASSSSIFLNHYSHLASPLPAPRPPPPCLPCFTLVTADLFPFPLRFLFAPWTHQEPCLFYRSSSAASSIVPPSSFRFAASQI